MHVNFLEYAQLNSRALLSVNFQEIEKAISALDMARSRGKTLWLAGNGGSAATASHFTADFNKTITLHQNKPLRTFAINDMTALVTAVANDITFEEIFSYVLAAQGNIGDVLICISVSGTSRNIVNAISKARQLGITSISIFGKASESMTLKADIPIIIDDLDYQIVENSQQALLHFFTKALS